MTQTPSGARSAGRQADPVDAAAAAAAAERRSTPVDVFVLIVGIVLGLVTQQSNAGLGLRVPALIASLFMVAHAINELRKLSAPRPVRSEPAVDAEHARPGARGQGAVPPPEHPESQNGVVPAVVMAVAIWLALATLTQEAEPHMLGLSLLAAFLLFSHGLREMRGE